MTDQPRPAPQRDDGPSTRPAPIVVAGVLAGGVAAVAASALIVRAAYESTGGGSTGRGMALAFSRMSLAALLTVPAWRRRPGRADLVMPNRTVDGRPGDPSLPASAPTRSTARRDRAANPPQRHFARFPAGTRYRALAGGVLLGLHFGTWLPSLAFTSVVASTTIVTTVPIWVVLITWVVRGERPATLTGAGVAIALAGGALVASGHVDGLAEASNPALGNALALVAAITYSGHLLLGQEVQARGLGLWRWTTVVGAVGALTVLPVVIFTAPGDGPYPLRFWAYAVALCVVSQIIGHSSLTWSTRWLSPTLVSVAILLEPVLASAGATVLYDEVPGTAVLIGAAVLVLGVAVTSLAERSPAATAPTQTGS